MSRFDLEELGGNWLSRMDGVTLTGSSWCVWGSVPARDRPGRCGCAGDGAEDRPVGPVGVPLHRAHPTAPVVNVAAGIPPSRSTRTRSRHPSGLPRDERRDLTLITLLAGWVVCWYHLRRADDLERLTTLEAARSWAVCQAFGLFHSYGNAWVDHLSIPGLTNNQTLYALTVREG